MNLNLHTLPHHGSGLLIMTDRESGKTLWESDMQQCTHCQHTWKYQPGSGIRRGFCNRCNAPTCGLAACDTCYHKEKQIEDLEAIAARNKREIDARVRQQVLREALFANPWERPKV